jgi:flagellar hook-associated protein 2
VITATNAHVSIDGLDVVRRSNDIRDALPGVVISAKQVAATAESLVIDDDNTTTRGALQKVVEAYNSVVSFVQGELDLDADTDRQKTLAGEPAMRMLQTRMQSILVKEIGGASAGPSALRTLADVGVRSARDGSLTIDDATFNAAMARDPAGIDRIFDDGLADFSPSVVAAFANTTDGVFTLRSKSLASEKKRMDDEIVRLEARAERYKDLLVARFTAMEKTVSSLKAIGNFLTAQDKKQDS